MERLRRALVQADDVAMFADLGRYVRQFGSFMPHTHTRSHTYTRTPTHTHTHTHLYTYRREFAERERLRRALVEADDAAMFAELGRYVRRFGSFRSRARPAVTSSAV